MHTIFHTLRFSSFYIWHWDNNSVVQQDYRLLFESVSQLMLSQCAHCAFQWFHLHKHSATFWWSRRACILPWSKSEGIDYQFSFESNSYLSCKSGVIIEELLFYEHVEFEQRTPVNKRLFRNLHYFWYNPRIYFLAKIYTEIIQFRYFSLIGKQV